MHTVRLITLTNRTLMVFNKWNTGCQLFFEGICQDNLPTSSKIMFLMAFGFNLPFSYFGFRFWSRSNKFVWLNFHFAFAYSDVRIYCVWYFICHFLQILANAKNENAILWLNDSRTKNYTLFFAIDNCEKLSLHQRK